MLAVSFTNFGGIVSGPVAFSKLFMLETSPLDILKVLINSRFFLFLEYFYVFRIFNDFENCFKVNIAIFKTGFWFS